MAVSDEYDSAPLTAAILLRAVIVYSLFYGLFHHRLILTHGGIGVSSGRLKPRDLTSRDHQNCGD